MTSAHRDLVLLVRLQGIYSEIAKAIAERNTPPTDIRELQEANRQRQIELEAIEAEIAANQEELKEVRKKEAEWELELEHFQKQKSMVTNEREFTAVISEIDYATKSLQETGARRKELEEAIASQSEDVTSRRQARPEEEAEQKDVVEGWERKKHELREQIVALAKQAEELEAEIHPKYVSRFRRLLESKQGAAVSAVVEGSCSYCHFALRPHLQQRVRRCEEIIDCEHCHRILYIAEILDFADDTTEG